MTRKQHTIIVVPHARARFRQFQVTSRLLWSVATAVSLSLVLGVVFGVLWIQSVRKNREVSTLAAENQDLRGRTKTLNAKLESLEKLLADFEERTRRLSVVAGLSGVHDPGTGGVGGLTTMPVDNSSHTAGGPRRDVSQGSPPFGPSRSDREEALLPGRSARPHPDPRPRRRRPDGRIRPPLGPVHRIAGVPHRNRHLLADGRKDRLPRQRHRRPGRLENGYGRIVEIAHGFGIRTLYAHLEATRVAEGQRVRRGDLVGIVGSTGRSTGPHLHYEVQVGGRPVNPLDYVLNAF